MRKASSGNETRVRHERGNAVRWALTIASMAAMLTVTSVAAAQAPVIRTVEFKDAVQLAVERNPTMATAAAAVAEANASVALARAFTRPTVGATMNNVTLNKAQGFAGGVTQPRNQTTFGATASVPLLAFNEWAAINQARDRIAVATENANEARRQVAMATAQTYLGVIAAKRQIEVDQRALESARAHLDYADKRLEGGLGSRLNQLRAAQAVSEDASRLEATKLQLRRAQEALGVLVVENGPVDAGADPAFEKPVVSENEWLANRADIRAQDASIAAAERVIKDTNKAWYPTAGVSFSPQVVTPTGLFSPSRSYRLLFSVSQPLFVTGVKAETTLRRIALDRVQIAKRALEIQARSEIRVAQDAVEALNRSLASARLAASQANEVLRISTAAFEVGATTNLEVIDAQRSARDADSVVAQAEDAVRRAQLDVLVAFGRFP